MSVLQIGEKGPPLDFQLISGAPSPTWKDLEGKVVLVDFWTTWCSPCVAAFPALNQLHQEFAGKDVAFFSVTYEPALFVRQFLEKHPLESTIGIDNTLGVFKSFHAWAIPVVFIFGRDGRLMTAVHVDHLDAALISQALSGKIEDVRQPEPYQDPAGAETYFGKLQRELQQKYPNPKS
ncbi:MAG TPA: TlpA disulfide reductase family protein [Chthoniobacterales bacterium]|nr:TlpA disulfide reductase family protein [Chthoniobacterales bacterium]